MLRQLLKRCAGGLVLAVLSAGPLLAQATGSITGSVADESGAVIPGVTIEATNDGTGLVRTSLTGSDGVFTVVQLAPGRYTVRAILAGFRTAQRDAVTVAVQTSSRVDFQLSVGSLEEAVTVVATVPLVETRSATLGLVVQEREVQELPLNGRNFTQLGTLMPGVIAPPAALGGAAGEATPGGFGATTAGFNVNGMRNQSNNFLLDGANNNDTFNTGFVLRPPPDAIQEFKILTNSYSAEYGRNAGSVVNVVTKGGSNTFHGAAWEFNRDDALEARNFFAPRDQPKPKLRQNQFGGSFGGPVVRNRFFGFGYYEGFRNTRGTTQNFVVLTDAQRTGNFGSTTIRDPLTGLPFPGNQIPASRLDPAAVALVEQFVPRANSGANRFIVSPDEKDDRDQFGARFDFQASAGSGWIARYIRSETDRDVPPTTRPIGTRSTATLQDVMASNTHVFTDTLINVARVSYNRIAASPAATSGLTNSAFGINVPHNVPDAQGLANITINGFFSLGDLQQPFVRRTNEVFHIANDVTWMRGNQQWKFGGEVQRQEMFIAFVNRPNGDFTFNGVHTGNAAADFLLGLPAQFRRTTQNTPQDGHGWLFGAYVQNEFRPRPNITVNAGVRYDVSVPFVDAADALNAFRPGFQSTRFPEAPAGLAFPGDPGIPRGTVETDRNNVAPRVGVAWDVRGDGRTSVRAAWGIFYDTLAGQGDFFQNGVLAPPFTPLLEVNAPPVSLTLADPLAAVTAGPSGFPPGLIFIGWGEDFKQPSAQHFNVTWQQEIARNMGVEAGYVGSRGKHLPMFIEVNPGLFAPGQTQRGGRLFPAFSLVRPTFSVAESWYDSLQASFRVRSFHGVSFLAAYTLGHARDHVSGLNIGGELRPVLPVTIGDKASIDRALSFEKGDALFDVRHRFVLSFTVELPEPRGLGPVATGLLGGWQINGIVQKQTGFPLTVIDPVTTIRFLSNRPSEICDPNRGAPGTVEQFFNTACFERRTLVDTAEPGNGRRNSVRGPGFAKTDLSLFKNIRLGNTHRIQLRFEAFNVFNQEQFGQPGNQIGTPSFGRITSAADGRIIQLAARYRF